MALHFQRRADGEGAVHVLNVTVPLIPENSGNYSIHSVEKPELQTTFKITASSDDTFFREHIAFVTLIARDLKYSPQFHFTQIFQVLMPEPKIKSLWSSQLGLPSMVLWTGSFVRAILEEHNV